MLEKVKYGKRFLNTHEAAEYINSAVQSLCNLRHLRRGPDYIKIGRKILYDIRDLDRYLESNKVKLTA